MRLMCVEDKEVKISEHDYRQLMKRLNPEKACVTLFGHYFIYAELICVNRRRKCSGCPLSDTFKKVNGCTLLFEAILGEELFKSLHFFDNGVLWESQSDGKARQALKILEDAFSEAKKV